MRRATDFKTAKPEDTGNVVNQRRALPHIEEAMWHRNVQLQHFRVAGIGDCTPLPSRPGRIETTKTTNEKWPTCLLRVHIVFVQPLVQVHRSMRQLDHAQQRGHAERQQQRIRHFHRQRTDPNVGKHAVDRLQDIRDVGIGAASDQFANVVACSITIGSGLLVKPDQFLRVSPKSAMLYTNSS